MKERVFKDPVHDFIYVYDKVILDLIDSKEMQRLRRIKQLGISYLTYHGAEHSRFSHSLGTYEVMRRILDKLSRKGELPLSEEDKLLCKVTALLHDCGHGPFSHSLESVFGGSHEQWSKDIILGDTEINQILAGISSDFPKKVAEVIDGKYHNKLVVSLISSQIDADRMDYLLRDSKATGVTYGQFDLDRIIRVMEINDGSILFRTAGMHSIESYVLARYSMYWQVYFHPTTRSGEIILKKIFKRARILCQQGFDFYLPLCLRNILTDNSRVKDYLKLDDAFMFTVFQYWSHSSDDILADLSSRILNRRLFKRIECGITDEIYEELVILFNRLGINPDYYLVLDHPSHISYDYYQPEDEHSKNPIYLEDKQGKINELSQLSDPVRAIAGKKQVMYNLYYPRDMILSGQGEIYDKIKNLLSISK
ncbi:HD domain-containing protein [Orenia marismortui]|uniref:HD domain-containing protein n=1 Tax=Orenia marismortui TaxID=46469 RepID=A0A4R8GRI8_9FIRM|nr:HD domain-containing protein [Orenia marismortui]TDX48449.1 hypothetical protein C7959_12718 [Orenia marismortui]